MTVRERFRNEVEAKVKEALDAMACKTSFEVEAPSTGIADLALPCFSLAKSMRKQPQAVAEELCSHISCGGLIYEVQPVNGYLNFYIDQDSMVRETLRELLESGEDYGRQKNKGIRVNVEHTSVNPTGPIHVGRARNPIIGDTLSRCLRRCGYDVETEYYVNDVGKQVVLLTWGVLNIPPSEVELSERDKTDHRLVPYYRLANQMMETSDEVREQIAEILRRFEAGDEQVISQVRKVVEMMLEGLKETLDAINVHLDRYVWESQYIADGSARRVVEMLKATPYCGVEDGAYYLELKDFGIQGKNTRFTFTRSDGTTLYTTRDLAYHLDKFSRADRVIDVLGEDQKLGNQQLSIALQILGVESKPEPLFYSFVSLPDGKMSTRLGKVVYLDDLIDEAVQRAYEEVRKRRDDLSEKKMWEIARIIGIGAIRYNILRIQPEKKMVFRWEDALNFDGNSAPFLQYAHARACSILRKAGDFEPVVDETLLTVDYERKLISVISQFPEVITECGENKRIHLLPSYGHELASAFNQFYAAVPVLTSGDKRNARLTLVDCSRTVMKITLETLGIVAPEEM
ncbi:MAG: arginyl-tRNA synthetase [Candidatus Methanomethylophilaceae archaeon]|nr:arginyl-tRNA synthetase [Candidatus Methanomethylophilaceae archaeon]